MKFAGTGRWVAPWLVLLAAYCWAAPQDDLYKASERGDRAAMTRAIKAGAKVDGLDADGWTALVYASAAGKPDAVKLLLAEKANPNATTKEGQTALMAAVVSGNADAVKALLDAGARTSVTLPSGKTAADLARARGRLDLVALLDVSPPAAATGSVKSAVKVASATGVEPDLIRSFLSEQRQLEVKRGALQSQREELERRLQTANAAKAQQLSQAHQRYESCMAELGVCQADCASSSRMKMLGALVGGVAVARKGGSTAQAEDMIRSSGDDEQSCKATCESKFVCEPARR